MNVLFIGGNGSNANANTVCVNNMADEMRRCGHDVWVLALGDEPGQIPDTYFGKLKIRAANNSKLWMRLWFKLVSIIRHITLLPFYPDVAPCRSRKVAKAAEKIVQNNDIKLVIAIFNVYENIFAGIRLKKKYGQNITVVTYHLDLRTSSVNPSKIVRDYIYRHALASLIEENRTVDKMLIPYSGKNDVEQLAGMDMNKVHFVGFPVFIKENAAEKCELPFEKGAINITYIGSLSSDNRNPKYILSLLEQITDKLGRKVLVHCWGDAADVKQILEDSPVARYHGKIDNRYVRYIMENSDLLLNIGNAVTYTMLPSKVFGMFATGKPIINVIMHPQDAIQPYFEMYHHSIDIREYQKNQADSELLANGISEMLNASLRDTKGLFDDFTPEAICKIIMEK